MQTLFGDNRAGRVLDIGLTSSLSNKCIYEDEHGKCKNIRLAGSKYCIWHKELIALRQKATPTEG